MKFEKKILKAIGDNFCIVGNSPIEIGSGRGNIIDKFEKIIRFNDFSLNYYKDYGKKVNIWVRATNDDVIKTLNDKKKNKYECIILRSLNKNNEESRKYWDKIKQEYVILPIEYERELSNKIKSIPSTGLLFLYILKENDFKVNNDNVFGFSFFDSNDLKINGSYHYFEKTEQKFKHNWQIEGEYYKKYILGEK